MYKAILFQQYKTNNTHNYKNMRMTAEKLLSQPTTVAIAITQQNARRYSITVLKKYTITFAQNMT